MTKELVLLRCVKDLKTLFLSALFFVRRTIVSILGLSGWFYIYIWVDSCLPNSPVLSSLR